MIVNIPGKFFPSLTGAESRPRSIPASRSSSRSGTSLRGTRRHGALPTPGPGSASFRKESRERRRTGALRCGARGHGIALRYSCSLDLMLGSSMWVVMGGDMEAGGGSPYIQLLLIRSFCERPRVDSECAVRTLGTVLSVPVLAACWQYSDPLCTLTLSS